jgi:hypothetical protein
MENTLGTGGGRGVETYWEPDGNAFGNLNRKHISHSAGGGWI